MSDATRAILHGTSRLRQLECWEWVVGFPRPSTDAADTSSFTLSRQRENIAAVEVGCLADQACLALRTRLWELKIEK